MDGRINNICLVEFAKISELADFQTAPVGVVLVTAAWQVLPVARPPRLQVTENFGKAGRSYESNFSVLLDTKVMNKNLLIVRVSFDDGTEPMIIGDPDLPVRFLEAHDPKSKSLSFLHTSWHYPYRQAVLAGSGSDGGGI
jgi:hypothetical protein